MDSPKGATTPKRTVHPELPFYCTEKRQPLSRKKCKKQNTGIPNMNMGAEHRPLHDSIIGRLVTTLTPGIHHATPRP
jgi:hypothetical protein